MEKQSNILLQSIMKEINKLSSEMGFVNKQSVKAIIKQEFEKIDENKERNMEHTETHVFSPNQTWSEEFLQEIKEEQLIVYNKGAYGVRIHPYKNGGNPRFEILAEDDGHLFTTIESPFVFDGYWTDKLIEVLNMAKDYWEEIKDKYKINIDN